MPRILYVIPSLSYGGAAKQLCLLARGLPRHRFEAHICVWESDGPLGQSLRTDALAVEVLGSRRLFDLQPIRRLRQAILQFQPDVIHVWQVGALRAAALATDLSGKRSRADRLPSLIGSALFEPTVPPASLGSLDRWLASRLQRLVVSGAAEAAYCRRLGLPGERTSVIPPGVAGNGPVDQASCAVALELPSNVRCLAAVGPFAPPKGFQDAIWALDILRYLYNDVHLLLIGDGSDRRRLAQFVRATGAMNQVHFLGWQADMAALLARAEIVVVPSRSRGGQNVVLEAMSAGRPVVASRLPALAELVVDGETGFLVRPGDKAAFARQLHVLLRDADLRRRQGEAGRRRAEQHFSAAQMVQRYTHLYETTAGTAA